MKKISLLIILSLIVLATERVSADATTTHPIRNARKELKNERANLTQTIKTNRTNLKNSEKQDFEDFREKAKTARENATSTDRKLINEQIKQDREALKAKFESEREALKEQTKKDIETFKEGKKVKLGTAQKTKVNEILNNAFTKLKKALATLTTIDSRISNIIASRKTAGLDTTQAEGALATARASSDEAKVAIDAVSSALTDTINSTNSVSKEAVVATIKKAQDAVKKAKTDYQAVLKLIPKTETEASTTNQINN